MLHARQRKNSDSGPSINLGNMSSPLPFSSGRSAASTAASHQTLRRISVYGCVVVALTVAYLVLAAPGAGPAAAPSGQAAAPVASAQAQPQQPQQQQQQQQPNDKQPLLAPPNAHLHVGPLARAQCPADAFPASQYVLMVDAGSTGSRIHVYKFSHCISTRTFQSLGGLVLDDELFEQVKPGLSSYPTDPAKAARSLDVLLDKAKARVPVELWGCTPIAVKATAGLRLIGAEKSEAILSAIRVRLETVYPFNVVKGDGISVMDGKDEGVFAWITVNYLRNSIGADAKAASAAIMDLGGGSTQIVFEPKSSITLVEGDHRTEINFGGKDYVLYQHSFLGYGLMEGRRKVLEAAISKLDSKLSCLGTDATMPVKKPGDAGVSGKVQGDVEIIGTNEGFDVCEKFVSGNLFDKDAKLCKVGNADTCSWDGVYMPKLHNSFEGDIYAFSYFYDRIADLGVLKKGNAEDGFEFTITEVETLAISVCKAIDGDEASKKSLPETVLKAMNKEPGLCLDLGFIYHMLKTGYELSSTRALKTAKKIKGVETGWCLGAAIHLADSMMGGNDGAAGVCRA
ncbi:nucleoside phosphatase family-domain-containing protein [Obelidium mucronatum]|nr:nucleoside phosphatase family-domain-containing protein [Obelidium mucronatum]